MKKPGNAGGAKARQEGGCVESMTKQEELSKVEETPKQGREAESQKWSWVEADWRQLEFPGVLPHLRIEPKLETCLIGNRTQFRTAYFFRLAETTGGVEGRNDKGIMCRSDHVKMTHLVK